MIHLSYLYKEQMSNQGQKLTETKEVLANLIIFVN